ncbi:Crp/Fnr family transcriptional regulator [Aliarcobacter cryaerophilus]|uniref:Crp/Fnr family transcriptional regulator n=1 Tax=Aliarcobacter cryaerophilus TaxID=28198 RepID=UPI00112F6CEC|nr:Crp/Fnr family transcriptional regulator [Aliarcobacter cryaerophilus]
MFDEILKKIEFFSLLSPKEIELINNSCKIITLNKNNILFYEGEIAKSFYILVQGNLKLYKTTTIGNEIIIHNFTQPTMLAEMATFQNSAFPATAISVSKITKVAILEKEVFISLLQKNGNLSFHIIGSLIKKMKSLEQTIHRNLVYDSTQRVCALLKDKPEILAEKKHLEVANLLNMAPETLSRSIKKLRDKGYLDKNNMIINYSFDELLV